MRDLNQLIIKFDHDKNFKDDDFYVSKSNEHIFKLLMSWPKWEKNFLNISGENFSGKSHLVNIFLKKFNGIKLETKFLTPASTLIFNKLSLGTTGHEKFSSYTHSGLYARLKSINMESFSY